MNIYKIKIFFLLMMISGLGLSVSSCVDDLMPDTQDDPFITEEGFRLAFRMNLESMTRDGDASDFEKYEDYIDPSSLRILFFMGDEADADNKYQPNTLLRQYRSEEITMIPVNSSGDSFSKEWYISVPVNDSYKDKEFAKVVRNNGFKIAVLANWPDVDPNNDLTVGDHINKLHHLSTESGTQGSEPYAQTSDNNKDAYSFLRDNSYPGIMGMFTNWVKDGKTVAEAKTFITTEYGPGNNGAYSKYGELWWLWNFSAADAADSNSGAGFLDSNNFAKKWAELNQNDLKEWLTKGGSDKGLASIGPIKSNAGNFQYIAIPEGNKEFTTPSKPVTQTVDGKSLTAINLTKGNKDINVIRLNIPNNGTLKIKWGSKDGKNAILKTEVRNHSDDESPKEGVDYIEQSHTTSDNIVTIESSKEIKITGDAEYLFLYSQTDNTLIYEIEYVSDYYLHNIDNVGRNPGSEQLIPMYGLQAFDALTSWKEGTVFDLSNFNHQIPDFSPKSIYMLRSVAKVEIKIPKSLKAHHVFLRCQNRKGRCEPVDVMTPTDQLWQKESFSNHSDDCYDWNKITARISSGEGIFYNPSTTGKSADQWNVYRQKLAWYYGAWADENNQVGGMNIYNPGSSAEDYPKIMNAMIGRTDFTEFLKSGSDSYYDRYVLYVPEKYVDDPASVGESSKMEASSPKVCHIEFRRGPDDDGLNGDPYTNVDDNWCYRVYFTENGYYGSTEDYPDYTKDSQNVEKNWENYYEGKVDILKHHWPIIRNHYYSFTITDANNRIIITRLEILPWRMVEENNYAW